MEIISKADAIAAGLKHYFTGKLCKHGHLAPKYVSGGRCVVCAKEHSTSTSAEKKRAWSKASYQRDGKLKKQHYYAANKASIQARRKRQAERYRETARRWYAANRHSLTAGKRAEYHADVQRSRSRRRQYVAANLGKRQAWARTDYLKNKSRYLANNAKRKAAKIQATPPWADYEEVQGIYAMADSVSRIAGVKFSVDHYVPLRGKTVCGLHCEANLQIILLIDNIAKGNSVDHL